MKSLPIEADIWEINYIEKVISNVDYEKSCAESFYIAFVTQQNLLEESMLFAIPVFGSLLYSTYSGRSTLEVFIWRAGYLPLRSTHLGREGDTIYQPDHQKAESSVTDKWTKWFLRRQRLCRYTFPISIVLVFHSWRKWRHILPGGAGMSLVVQWRSLSSPNLGSLLSVPGQGTRPHMLQLRSSTVK